MTVKDTICTFLANASWAVGFRSRQKARETLHAARRHMYAALQTLVEQKDWPSALLVLDCLDGLQAKNMNMREPGWSAAGWLSLQAVSDQVRAECQRLAAQQSSKSAPVGGVKIKETITSMSNLFVPWVGPDYAASNPKIMVVGETSWGEWSLTQIVENLLLPTTGSGTWTGFVKAATNSQGLTRQDRAAFLNRIVFFNYVVNFHPVSADDSAVSDAQRADPDNQRTLRHMVQRYQPTHIIVWGVPNFKSMVQPETWAPIVETADGAAYSTLSFETARIPAIGIKHPAIGFSSLKWGPILADFLIGKPIQ